MNKNETPITQDQIQNNRDEFITIIREYVKRQGIDELLEWVDGTDFFRAPASTRFHEAYEGGLCEHSLEVFHKLEALNAIALPQHKLTDEQLAIVALFHDLCKTAFYKQSFRNKKNEETGTWEKVPVFEVEDHFPFGHGEKSVWLVERFMKLKPIESIAIRWHMGGFDESSKGGSFACGNAYEKYPATLNLHIADMQATYQKN